MSSRTCPDWPRLMEIAPDLQFMHYSVAAVQLPTEALMKLDGVSFDELSICCDLEHHVFNPEHTDGRIAAALRETHWFDLREWVKTGPGGAAA